MTRPRLMGAVAAAACWLAALAAPSYAAATTDPAEAAAGWLGRQFVDGDHLESAFGGMSFPDAGLTIDGVLALTAAGVGGDVADAAMQWLGQPDNIALYAGDGTTELYAGATAKLALAAMVRGADPRDFGADGVDLIARLTSRQQVDGRFTDQSVWGDFSNSFSQSFALLALDRAGESAPIADATDYLVAQQCDDGGFPEALDAATCVSQVDATALAVQALLAVGATAAASDAVGYLESQADATGGFGNANSTGLVAAALAAAGSDAADDAVAALLALQQGCAAPGADRGAIAFDGSGLDDRAVRATAQAILGLVGVDLATLTVSGTETATLPELDCPSSPTPTTPTTAAPPTSTTLPSTPPQGQPMTSLARTSVAAGGSLTIAEPGFAPGESVVVALWSEPVVLARTTAGADGVVRATVAIPAGTAPGEHTLALLGETVTKTVTLTVTGAASGGALPGALPATGAGVGALATAGAISVVAGALLVLAARRRAAVR